MVVQELINGTLRLLGVYQTGEAPTAQESKDALEALNLMLNSWVIQGVNLGYPTLTLQELVPYQDWHLPCFRYNLAIELAPEYGIQINPALAKRAEETFRAVQARYSEPPEMSVPEALHPYYNPNELYT